MTQRPQPPEESAVGQPSAIGGTSAGGDDAGGGPADTDSPEAPAVPDAARAVLSRMRAAARSAPSQQTTRPRSLGTRSRPRRTAAGYSGPGPDDRDPMTLGGAWGTLIRDRGWGASLDVAALYGLWPQIVGAANAEHAAPETFDDETGTLVIRTSSTAWAEQLRLMLPTLRAAIDAQVGAGVVREITLLGPTPPRTRGRLRVRGRGPRDTYG